jgi:hypothetical protein
VELSLLEPGVERRLPKGDSMGEVKNSFCLKKRGIM